MGQAAFIDLHLAHGADHRSRERRFASSNFTPTACKRSGLSVIIFSLGRVTRPPLRFGAACASVRMASLPCRGGLGSYTGWRHERTEVPYLFDHRGEYEQALRRPHRRSRATLSIEAVSWGTSYDLFDRARAFSCSTISPCSSSSLSWSVSRLLRSVRKSTLPTAYPACADSRVSRAWG